MRKLIFVLIASVALTACSTSSQRTSAGRLAAQVAEMQGNLAALAQSRTSIAIARDHTMERLLRSAIRAESFNASQSLTSDQRRMLTAAINSAEAAKTRKAKADAEMQAMEAIAKAETSRIDIHTEDFAAAAKLLSRLSEKPSWSEQLNFYFHFFNEVKDSLDEMDENAQRDATAATAATSATASTATAAVPPAAKKQDEENGHE